MATYIEYYDVESKDRFVWNEQGGDQFEPDMIGFKRHYWIEMYDGNDYVKLTNGDDRVWGGNGHDSVIGGTGNDALYGEWRDDTLQGNTDNDLLAGGDGNDALYGGAGNDNLWGGAGTDGLFGGTGTDALYGNEGDDILQGETGDDILRGNTSNDYLSGGDGNDYLIGGGEAYNSGEYDTLVGNAGKDTFVLGKCGVGNYYLRAGHATLHKNHDNGADSNDRFEIGGNVTLEKVGADTYIYQSGTSDLIAVAKHVGLTQSDFTGCGLVSYGMSYFTKQALLNPYPIAKPYLGLQ